MKQFCIVLILLMVSFSAKSQNCTAPVSGMVFKQKYSQLTVIRQDQQRLRAATEFARKNCLLIYQVKQIAELFNDDITRLTFIQDAFPAIFDKENKYDLYDAFAYFSTAMRLHDFMESPLNIVTDPLNFLITIIHRSKITTKQPRAVSLSAMKFFTGFSEML